MGSRLETQFERLLWGSRLLVIVAVVASLAASLAMFYVATIDVVGFLASALSVSAHPHSAGGPDQALLVLTLLDAVDDYLIAAVLIVFALGLYELYISRIDIAEASELAPRLLLVHSLDDFKDRLTAIVLLILVIRVFGYLLHLPVQNTQDLLFVAMTLFLVAAALYLSHRPPPKSGPPQSEGEKDSRQ